LRRFSQDRSAESHWENRGRETIQVCYYKGCGAVYGEKEPLSDKTVTHGLCPRHLEICLKEIKAEVEKRVDKAKKLRVLIVEDSTFFRESFTLALRERFPSIEFCGASDGEEALREVGTLPPHLIFMDIRLPGENGLELTRRIKTSHPDIIIIIFTSYDLPEYRERASQYRADYFFSKGSSTKDIFQLVESILPSRV
jgi:CheY-like chemotaxis protein